MSFLRLIQGTPQPQADLTRVYLAEFSGVDVSRER